MSSNRRYTCRHTVCNNKILDSAVILSKSSSTDVLLTFVSNHKKLPFVTGRQWPSFRIERRFSNEALVSDDNILLKKPVHGDPNYELVSPRTITAMVRTAMQTMFILI